MTIMIASGSGILAVQKTQRLLALLFVGTSLGTSITHAATGGAVAAWGVNWFGQTMVTDAALSGVTAIAAGANHTVALKSDGSVIAWGFNSLGQTTVPVAARSGVTAIAAGGNNTVALKSDGSVVAWGDNSSGQTTVPVAAQSGVTAIAAGGYHTVALKSDGSVVAWGDNSSGQTTVPVAARSGVTAIAAGDYHTVALKSDGSVVAWGENGATQTTMPVAARSGVTAIAAGGNNTVALKLDGSVVAWGDNLHGQIAVPAGLTEVTAIAISSTHTVALKKDNTVVTWGDDTYGQATVPVAARSGVLAVAVGYNHTVALVLPTPPTIVTPPESQAVDLWQSATFTVAATGYPLYYQWRKDGLDIPGETGPTYWLGHVVTNLTGGSYTAVVSNLAGSITSTPPAVLTVNPASPGAVVMLGVLRGTWPPIAAQSGVTAIVASLYYIAFPLALKGDGTLVGTLGGNFSVPEGLSGVTSIAAGGLYFAALKQDGTVAVWGGNVNGQVTGEPPDVWGDAENPLTLGGRVLTGVTAIATGENHTVALKNDGTVAAWGYNAKGQVTGTPSTNDPSYAAHANPVILSGEILSGVRAVAPGGEHNVVLKNDGTVAAWGYNANGQVTGIPSNEDPYSAVANPVILGGEVLRGVTAIAVGDNYFLSGAEDESGYTVALKSDGSVVAWGDNSYGQTTVPKGLTGVTAIAAGYGRTLALKNDGTVVAWGYNADGQVTGTPSNEEPHSAVANPVTLNGRVLSGVTAIATAFDYTVALKSDGTLAAWGNDWAYNDGPDSDSAFANPVTLNGQVLSGVTAISVAAYRFPVAIVGTALTLQARASGDRLVLSWPAGISGITLQSTLNLTPPLAWIDSKAVPAVVDGKFTITNMLSGNGQGQFFRLWKP